MQMLLDSASTGNFVSTQFVAAVGLLVQPDPEWEEVTIVDAMIAMEDVKEMIAADILMLVPVTIPDMTADAQAMMVKIIPMVAEVAAAEVVDLQTEILLAEKIVG